ncbi:MAG: hypothetical protein HY841_11700 [Bacteroidetes bacterium]|nr:hypothetical protein [Bacteroidota bacterium]
MTTKTLASILITLLLASAALFMFQSCSSNYYAIDESVLIDKTDSFLASPDSTVIKNLFDASSALWQGYRFRLLTLSDVDYNSVYEASLSPACEYLSNVYAREDESTAFLSKIESAFAKVKSIPSGRNYSSLYLPMAKELKRLSESAARRRILIVYSDLMENTSAISFYKADNLQLLETNQDSVKKILESEIPLPDIKNIEVHFIYQPKDNKENELFREVSGFYKKWLENKGARVTIEANLILNNTN